MPSPLEVRFWLSWSTGGRERASILEMKMKEASRLFMRNILNMMKE